MIGLKTVAFVVGGAICVLSAPGVLNPEIARKWLKGFPRSRFFACSLTAIDMAWAGWILYHATFLVDLAVARWMVILLSPVAFLMIIFLLDELLAPRSLGPGAGSNLGTGADV